MRKYSGFACVKERGKRCLTELLIHWPPGHLGFTHAMVTERLPNLSSDFAPLCFHKHLFKVSEQPGRVPTAPPRNLRKLMAGRL